MRGFTVQIKRASGLVQKLNFSSINVFNGDKIDSKFMLEIIKVIDQTAKLREQALQKEKQIRAQSAKQQSQQTQQQIQQREKVLQEEQKIRKAIEDENKEIKKQIELYTRLANVKVKDLQRRFSDGLDTKSVENLKGQINGLNSMNFTSLDQFKQKSKRSRCFN